MGRGLSKLQKWILLQAYEKEIKAEEKIETRVDATAEEMLRNKRYPRHSMAHQQERSLFFYEICNGYYGWIANRRGWVQRFSREAIGESRYRSAMVAICKAALRLEQRGLCIALRRIAYERSAAIFLTPDGVTYVMANLLPAPGVDSYLGQCLALIVSQ